MTNTDWPTLDTPWTIPTSTDSDPWAVRDAAYRVDCWFGSWRCGCTDVEPHASEISNACPFHHEPLLAAPEPIDDPGLNGWGVLDRNNEPMEA